MKESNTEKTTKKGGLKVGKRNEVEGCRKESNGKNDEKHI